MPSLDSALDLWPKGQEAMPSLDCGLYLTALHISFSLGQATCNIRNLELKALIQDLRSVLQGSLRTLF